MDDRAAIKDIFLGTTAFQNVAIDRVKQYSDRETSDQGEKLAQAFTSVCITTSNSVVHLLEGGYIFEALIISRSVLDSAVKAWLLLLSRDTMRMERVSDFELLVAAELRRKRWMLSVFSEAEDELNELGQLYSRLIGHPESFGIPVISDKEMKRLQNRFSFRAMIEDVERDASQFGMTLNLQALRLHYAETSGFSHAGVSSIHALESMTTAPFEKYKASWQSNAATVCGIQTLAWYYMLLFWSLFKNKASAAEHEAYLESRDILARVKELCDAKSKRMFELS